MRSGPERVERRLAAILAADVVGYSRLIGVDEEGTLARLKVSRRELIDPIIAAHKGRIVKTTGDGLLVEFASIVDALRCAVEVQQAMAERNAGASPADRIDFRIGIHQGDIVVEDGDILGDGVNIAARLEGLAEPGGICVSARVQEDAAGRLAHSARVGADAPLALPDKPSVAVLPFANMSSDPEQEFLADGIAEDVITALSRYPSLFVIARNSCFTYKGRAVDVKQVGRELGVRYVLEGSLRKAGNRIRATAQLVEAETGNHVWAERYDRDLADIFAVQDEITEAVTIAIAPAIAEAERQRAMRKPPENLDAWAAYQRGQWHLARGTAEDTALAERFFQQAINCDPNFAGGYHGLAQTCALATTQFQQHTVAEALEWGEPLARKAITLDAGDAEAHACLAVYFVLKGDGAAARQEADRALAMTPNLARAHGTKGVALIVLGERKAGVASLSTAIRLDPVDPIVMVRLSQVALGLYLDGLYEAAVEAAMRAIRSFPDFPPSYRYLAMALGQLERTEAAAGALAKAVALAPGSFDMYIRNRAPWFRLEDHAHMVDGLRKAGWKG
jgi:adenylate cyclase